jgi:hypothetical protein
MVLALEGREGKGVKKGNHYDGAVRKIFARWSFELDVRVEGCVVSLCLYGLSAPSDKVNGGYSILLWSNVFSLYA